MFIEKKPNLLNFILKQAFTEENKSTFFHQYAKKKKTMEKNRCLFNTTFHLN